MRQSEAAMALIRRIHDGQTLWLAQWNRKWGAYHFVGGQRGPRNRFARAWCAEIGEELKLSEGPDFQVSLAPPVHLEFIDFSASTQTRTRYIMELFRVELMQGPMPPSSPIPRTAG